MSLGINEPTTATAPHDHGPLRHTHGGLIGAGQHEHPGDIPIHDLFPDMFPDCAQRRSK